MPQPINSTIMRNFKTYNLFLKRFGNDCTCKCFGIALYFLATPLKPGSSLCPTQMSWLNIY